MNHSSSHEHLVSMESSYIIATEKKIDRKYSNAIDKAFDRNKMGEKTFCKRCGCHIETCEIICPECDRDIDLEKEVILCQ